MRKYQSTAQRRKNRQDIAGLAIICATLLSFAGLLYGAAELDRRNGISPAASMCNNGFTGFCAAAKAERPAPFVAKLAAVVGEAPAIEARLIGECGGRLYAGTSESSFPAGCAWIEPIRTESRQ